MNKKLQKRVLNQRVRDEEWLTVDREKCYLTKKLMAEVVMRCLYALPGNQRVQHRGLRGYVKELARKSLIQLQDEFFHAVLVDGIYHRQGVKKI